MKQFYKMPFFAATLLVQSVLSVQAAPPEACKFFTYRATITSVYDGDTVRADIDLGFHIWVRDERFRLFGIDAPELRSRKNYKVSADEKARAILSRDKLRDLVLGKQVVLCTIKDKKGKYGRYLAKIFVADVDVNSWMITNGYAVPYGKKLASDVAEKRFVVADKE